MTKNRISKAQRLAAAKAAHDKFLRSVGVDPKSKPLLRGAVVNPLHANSGVQCNEPRVPTSDTIPGNGVKVHRVRTCDLPIAQVYHKGPLMVVTDMKSLDGSKRRS